MQRGRPVKSEIRQNVVEILYVFGPLFGYQIFKIYNSIFKKVHIRSIYYHLKKGESLAEIEVDSIKKVKGDYSWGGEAEKIYYKTGKNASPKLLKIVKDYYDKNKTKFK